ncbi:MAG: competence protein ComEC, partial [Subtercola sp.]|nr:competence protein ComEC [Subtercola sp.]
MISDLRLVVPAAACWLVSAVLVGISPGWLGQWSLLVGIGAFAAAIGVLLFALLGAVGRARVARHRRQRRMTTRAVLGSLGVSLAVVGVVCVSISAQQPARSPARVEALSGHTVTVTLTVGSAAVQSEAEGFSGPESSTRFSATVTRLSAGGRESELRMPVLVFVRSSSTRAPEIGSQLRLSATLQATDPGETVVYLLFATGDPTAIAPAPWYLAWANQLRARFRDSAATLPGEGAQLVPGLAIGDVTLVSDELDTNMINSGLSHLTAVSGANCAVVVAAIMLLGGAIGLSKRWRIVLCLVLMAAFVVLVTPSASVLRAGVMATIVLVTLASGRAPRGLPALAVATMIMLVADPWLSRSYGLALSVLATAGLLLLTRPIQQALARWLPGGLTLLIAVPLAAQLACQPVLVLLAPQLSTYSVPANLLAEPAAPVATVVGLVSCLVGALVPGLAPIGAWLTWVPASWIAGVATFFAEAPGSSIPWPGGAVGVALVVALTAAAFVAVFARESAAGRARRVRRHLRRAQRPPDAPRMPGAPVTLVRIVSAAVVVLTVTIYAGAGIGSALGGTSWPPGWHIAACDIGQGDSVVVRDPDTGRIALIDVGPDPVLLTTCLHRLGITTIDLLVLTHYDLDHVGGLSAVLGRVSTAMLGPPEDSHDAEMADALTKGGADVRHPTRGDSGALGDLSYSILWPEAGTALRANDACVTVQFTGAIRSLFLGDLGEDSQKMVMAANDLTHEDVVKVAH